MEGKRIILCVVAANEYFETIYSQLCKMIFID